MIRVAESRRDKNPEWLWPKPLDSPPADFPKPLQAVRLEGEGALRQWSPRESLEQVGPRLDSSGLGLGRQERNNEQMLRMQESSDTQALPEDTGRWQ